MADGIQGIQGHHIIPQQIARDFAEIFTELLPGWDLNGEYNFSAIASNAKIAAQLDIPMHAGSHSWLNEALGKLLVNTEFTDKSDAEKTKMLAGLVNVLRDAEDPNGTKTNGFHTVTHKSDPRFLDKLGGKLDTDTLKARVLNDLTWDKIKEMPSYQEVEALSPRRVMGDDGKLKRGGSVDLNRLWGFSKWFSASVTPLPLRVSAG